MAAPSGRMSCSQRTSGSFLSPELAIAGSRAGKLGEATSIRSGRGRSGRPRKGLAAARAAVKLSSCRSLAPLVSRPAISGTRVTRIPLMVSCEGRRRRPQRGSG